MMIDLREIGKYFKLWRKRREILTTFSNIILTQFSNSSGNRGNRTMERMELSILPIHHPRIPSEFRASDSEGCSNRVSSISRTRRWPIKQGIYRRDEWLYMDGLMEMSNLGLTIRDGRGGRQTEASINPRRQVSLLPWPSKGSDK